MTETEVMCELEGYGSEQTRKTWVRHGVCGAMFGVKYGDLAKLQKKIKTDQALADRLWATGNHDARILATQVADPARMTHSQLEDWVKESNSYIQCGAVGGVAAKSPHGWKCVEKWTAQTKKESICAAGWDTLASLAMNDADADDARFEPYLKVIEKDIHKSLNRVRYSMNAALIAIGGRNDTLEKRALAVAKAIGKVEVDHGDTCCKTPDAAGYIKKMSERRKSKRAK
jgi:3-methyladenine DNA glycosylase AlkD